MLNSTFESCAIAPDTASSDAGVAGTGILLAFIITAGLALLLSSYIVLSEIRSPTKCHHPISRKLLNGLSDQQIVEGIAIQALGLARIDTMIPYHFFVIWMLSLLSTATNFAALLALVQDYKRDWVLRWMRQFAMFVNMCLTIVFGVLVLETNWKDLPQTLPVGCLWDNSHAKGGGDAQSTRSNTLVSVAGTIAVIATSGIIFGLATWYLHLRKQLWGRFVRLLSLAILFAIAIAAAVRVVLISQAFGTPPVILSDQGEIEWSFGQLLTMLLLILPLISALEIYRGELQVPGEKPLVDVDQIHLTGGATRYSYQPTPWSK